MRCFFTFAVAAALAVGMSATLRSQTGGAGGAGGSGGASGSAGASGTSGTAGAAGTAGTSGTAGTAGTAGAAGTARGTAGTVGATNGAAATGNVGVSANALGPQTAGAGRVNANAGVNRAAASNFNGRASQMNGQDFSFPNQTPFFNDPRVRQQVNLNDSQFNTLSRAYQDAYARYQQSVNNLSPALSPEQRDLQIQQLQAQFNQSFATPLNRTLTNRQSLNRFNQLNRQFMGPNAFNDPSIRQQLNLSQAQIRQLRSLQNNWRQQLQQFRQTAGQDQNTANNPQWTQFQQQYVSSLNSILTPEQQQMWMQQVGQQFPTTPNSFMTQQLPEGNVNTNANTNTTAPVGAGVPRNQVNGAAGAPASGVQPPTGSSGTTSTQVPAGTQSTNQGTTTQGTTAPATASGTQGGTVR